MSRRGIARDHHQRNREAAGACAYRTTRRGVRGTRAPMRCGGGADSTCNALASIRRPARATQPAASLPRSLVSDPVSQRARRPAVVARRHRAMRSPIVHDIRAHRPGVARRLGRRGGFAPLVALVAASAASFRSRCGAGAAQPLDRATWREVARFPPRAARDRYDAVLDLQEQVKGALIARLARGARARLRPREHPRAAGDAARRRPSSRSPRDLHFDRRCRALAAAALGYAARRPPRLDLRRAAGRPRRPTRRTRSSLHATSRADKLWPEAHWRALIAHFAQAGLAVVLPWGNAAEEATQPAGSREACRGAVVAARRRRCRRSRRCSRTRRARRRRRHRSHASGSGARHADGRAVHRHRPRARRRRARRAALRATWAAPASLPSPDEVIARRRRACCAHCRDC